MLVSGQRIGALPLSIEELELVKRAARRSGLRWERFFINAGVEKAVRLLIAEQPVGETVTSFMPVI